MDMLEILAQNEEKISQLYDVFAKQYPPYKGLWAELSQDEKEHAKWIRKIIPQVKSGKVKLDSDRFNTEAVITYQNYLDEEIEKTKQRQQPIMTSLTITLYIEKSLIEHRFFDIFDGDSVELTQMLAKLEEATKNHLAKVQKIWSASRF